MQLNALNFLLTSSDLEDNSQNNYQKYAFNFIKL